MGLFDKFFGKKKASEIFSDDELIEANVCPNCWGALEYDGVFKKFVEDQTKGNINHDHSNQKAFVQQFVETNITGIRLKSEGDHLACPRCKKRYKNVSSKAN